MLDRIYIKILVTGFPVSFFPKVNQMTWVCSGCTFENISSKSELYCQVCQSQRPFGFVSCLTCTYFNSAANSNCEMCGVDLGNKSGTIADLLTVELPMKRKLAEDREDSRKQARNDVEIISSTSHPSSNIAINNYVNDARNSVNDGDVEIISSSSRKEVSPKPPVQPYQARDINLKWDGCVGMTACPTSSSTLTLPSILQTKDLVYAAFSSYCIDNDWLMSLIPSHIPWTIFNQRPKDLDPNTEIMNIAPGKRLVFPKMKGAFGCMHIKFLILFYPTRCRFILPSANIVVNNFLF